MKIKHKFWSFSILFFSIIISILQYQKIDNQAYYNDIENVSNCVDDILFINQTGANMYIVSQDQDGGEHIFSTGANQVYHGEMEKLSVDGNLSGGLGVGEEQPNINYPIEITDNFLDENGDPVLDDNGATVVDIAGSPFFIDVLIQDETGKQYFYSFGGNTNSCVTLPDGDDEENPDPIYTPLLMNDKFINPNTSTSYFDEGATIAFPSSNSFGLTNQILLTETDGTMHIFGWGASTFSEVLGAGKDLVVTEPYDGTSSFVDSGGNPILNDGIHELKDWSSGTRVTYYWVEDTSTGEQQIYGSGRNNHTVINYSNDEYYQETHDMTDSFVDLNASGKEVSEIKFVLTGEEGGQGFFVQYDDKTGKFFELGKNRYLTFFNSTDTSKIFGDPQELSSYFVYEGEEFLTTGNYNSITFVSNTECMEYVLEDTNGDTHIFTWGDGEFGSLGNGSTNSTNQLQDITDNFLIEDGSSLFDQPNIEVLGFVAGGRASILYVTDGTDP